MIDKIKYELKIKEKYLKTMIKRLIDMELAIVSFNMEEVSRLIEEKAIIINSLEENEERVKAAYESYYGSYTSESVDKSKLESKSILEVIRNIRHLKEEMSLHVEQVSDLNNTTLDLTKEIIGVDDLTPSKKPKTYNRMGK